MPSRFLAPGALAAALFLSASASAAPLFEPLFMVTKVVGDVRIEKPNGTTDVVRPDHAYPFGSRILVPAENSAEAIKDAKARDIEIEPPQVYFRLARDFTFRIGPGSDVRIVDESTGEGEDRQELKVFDVARGSVQTRISAAAKKTGGTLDDKVEKNLAAVIVRTPVGEASRLAERNEVTVEESPDAPGFYNCLFFTQAGYMEIAGPQYQLTRLKRATRVRICGTDAHNGAKNAHGLVGGNESFTSIEPESGEFMAEFEKGADNNEKAFFRTRHVAKIWRRHAEVGGRLVVAVMISRPDGSRTQYAYLEGQTGVDTGDVATTEIGGEEGADEGGWGEGDDGGEGGDSWGDDGGDDGGDSWGDSGDAGEDMGFEDWNF